VTRATRLRIFLLLCLSCAAHAQPGDPDARVTILTRDAPRGIGAVVESMGPEGVRIRVPLGSGEAPERLIAWTELRTGADAWSPPPAYEDVHARSVLAAARRDRGDLTGAAPLIAPLAPDLIGAAGAQAHAVFGILLDEALARLDLMDAASAMVAPGGGAPAWSGYDRRWALDTRVPFVPSPRSAGPWDADLDRDQLTPRDELILDLMAAVLEDSDADPQSILDRAASIDGDPGIELAALMVAAQTHPDPEARARSRDRLASRAAVRPGSWIDAWSRLAIAESYARSGEPGDTLRALVELTHVIVRFRATDPELARLAMTRYRTIARARGLTHELERMERAWSRGRSDATLGSAAP